MLPLTAGVVYRFTYLDDAIGVPLVPYGKFALAYYLWWSRAPDGSLWVATFAAIYRIRRIR